MFTNESLKYIGLLLFNYISPLRMTLSLRTEVKSCSAAKISVLPDTGRAPYYQDAWGLLSKLNSCLNSLGPLASGKFPRDVFFSFGSPLPADIQVSRRSTPISFVDSPSFAALICRAPPFLVVNLSADFLASPHPADMSASPERSNAFSPQKASRRLIVHQKGTWELTVCRYATYENR
jgi:hypothetical protein